MQPEIEEYNRKQAEIDRKICDILASEIEAELPEAESKIWHAHPVWFLDGNPIVGYSTQKNCTRLLFWSGQSFDEALIPEGKFKAAELRFTAPEQIDHELLKRCLSKARDIQWDYKNLVKRKGQLERLK
ncbi:DUF1801 domain-containing protein [Marinilongibacter aquaticus]|uniref:DUF1801 domain-containing protein n=1 Tax=Marinilongibacter aquaticus TaxID=2975157 RepID=UPI0021BDA1E7|nr:DUF1801 domain-containing protein [Marinilongibacter aquaticus]UBM60136.1 DUF1801 domain-containing protein [Marinilongibacter aquaticus]